MLYSSQVRRIDTVVVDHVFISRPVPLHSTVAIPVSALPFQLRTDRASRIHGEIFCREGRRVGSDMAKHQRNRVCETGEVRTNSPQAVESPIWIRHAGC